MQATRALLSSCNWNWNLAVQNIINQLVREAARVGEQLVKEREVQSEILEACKAIANEDEWEYPKSKKEEKLEKEKDLKLWEILEDLDIKSSKSEKKIEEKKKKELRNLANKTKSYHKITEFFTVKSVSKNNNNILPGGGNPATLPRRMKNLCLTAGKLETQKTFPNDVEMKDVEEDHTDDMEWEETVALTKEQLDRLETMRNRAMRIKLAKHKQRMFRESQRAARDKQELENNLKSWIQESTDRALSEEKEFDLVCNDVISVRGLINLLSLETGSVNRRVASTGSWTALRETVSWSLEVSIEPVEVQREVLKSWLESIIWEELAELQRKKELETWMTDMLLEEVMLVAVSVEAVAVNRLSAEFTEMTIDPLETVVISDISRVFVKDEDQLEGMKNVPETQPISEGGATTDKEDDTVDKLGDLREMFKSLMRIRDKLCVSYDRAQKVLDANKPGEYSLNCCVDVHDDETDISYDNLDIQDEDQDVPGPEPANDTPGAVLDMTTDETTTEGWKQNENLQDGWRAKWKQNEISSSLPANDTTEEVVDISTSPLTISDASPYIIILPGGGKPANPVQQMTTLGHQAGDTLNDGRKRKRQDARATAPRREIEYQESDYYDQSGEYKPDLSSME